MSGEGVFVFLGGQIGIKKGLPYAAAVIWFKNLF